MFRTTALTAALLTPIPPMRRIIALAAVIGIASSFAPVARAEIITFSGLPGGNNDPFTTYSEVGFQVAPTAGSWTQVLKFGNPMPCISGVTASETIDVTRLTPGLFTFQSIDLEDTSFSSAGVTYTFLGQRNGVTQFSLSGGPIPDGVFTTIPSSNSAPIDLLRVTVSSTSMPLGFAIDLDNIQVTSVSPVPAPPAVVLVGLGAGCVALKRYVGRRATA
jgi:hypothetical protein